MEINVNESKKSKLTIKILLNTGIFKTRDTDNEAAAMLQPLISWKSFTGTFS